jgi:hypothetical protein
MHFNSKGKDIIAGSISRSGRGDKEESTQAYAQYVEEHDDAVNKVMGAKADQQ